MSQARALYQVQELELAIIEHAKEIKDINARLQDDEEIKGLEARFDAARSSLEAIVKRVNAMELQIEAVAAKRQAAETRLYSGSVKNPKELQDMQMEADGLARRRAELEERLLLLMVEREEAGQILGDGETALKAARGKHKAEHQSLRQKKTALTEAAEGLMAERRQALKSIPADVIKTYNSLRTAKANRPVSVLKGKVCGVCGIKQSNLIIASINRGDDWVQCRNCGRILIRL